MLKYFKEPCLECIVQATCAKRMNYQKTHSCDYFYKYVKRKEFFESIGSYTVMTFTLILFLIPILWILVSMVWGSYSLATFLYRFAISFF